MKELVETKNLEQEIFTLKNQIMPNASDGDLKLFAKFCAKTKLDPFSRQIYAINRGGRYTYQTSIDGFRVVAERSGLYEGQTPTYWCDENGEWKDVWLSNKAPCAAKVGVYKKGHREATWAVAKFSSYAQVYNGKLSGLWAKMPEVMIAKCAESLALRKAFPNDLSGMYTDEEMSQADNQTNLNQTQVVNEVVENKTEVVEAEVVSNNDLGDYIIPFGRKFKNKKLSELKNYEISGYVNYLESTGAVTGPAKTFIEIAKKYLDESAQ